MKKFLLLLGIVALLVGMRLYYNGLLSYTNYGKFTIYHFDGTETVIEGNLPLLDKWNEPVRLDLNGGIQTAKDAVKFFKAEILFNEQVDDITIFYLYSPMLIKTVTVKGRQISLMIAVRQDNVAIGTPILKGSF